MPVDVLIWPGSSSFSPSGSETPFGIYDNDAQFVEDAPKVAKWCAIRLGYPIQNVELISINFFACFEEAVSEYGAQVNQWNIRNNLDILKGAPGGTNYTQRNVQGTNIPSLLKLSDAYGTLSGVGGNTDIKKAYITLQQGVQEYDFYTSGSVTWPSGSETDYANRIDITKVYFEAIPAINRFFDPYSISGQGTLNLIDEFGFGSFSPASQFVLMPVFEDLLRIQAIEFNDQIRKSSFTFNIVNGKIRIFPIPTSVNLVSYNKLYFDYFVRDEFVENSTAVSPSSGSAIVSDYSNIRYDFIPYEQINDVGRQWIRKYTLALAKELLGGVREKYSTIPIPGSEVSLDGAALRSEAVQEKEFLVTQLRENLEDLSRKNQFEAKAAEADQTQQMLQKIPLMIYVG
jgi:hypothetical protein